MRFPLRLPAFSWRYYAAFALAAAVLGYVFLRDGTNGMATLTIVPGDFKEQVSVSGTVVAAKSAALGFAANGRIAGVYARVGERVAAGAMLAQTENGDLTAALAQKRAALEEASANLASLRAGTRAEELAIASAAVESAKEALIDAVQDAYTTSDDAIHNKVDTFFTNPRSADPKLTFATANANLKLAVERDRMAAEQTLLAWATLVKDLSSATVADGAATSATYLARIITLLADINAAINQGVPDSTVTSATLSSYGTTLATARTNVNAAASTLTTERADLDSAEKNLTLKQAGSTPEAIAAKEAAVAAARAEVVSAEAALTKTRVHAPFAGVVTRMDAKVGEIVSPATSLISMQSDGVFQIETFVPEVVIARVAAGNPATTTLDAYGSSVEFPATVVAVDPAETVKDGVPTYKTTLAFLTDNPAIRSGMTANVTIETGVRPNAIVIPSGAVGTRDGASFVSVVESDAVTSRPVTLGTAPMLGQIEILSGLSAGDTILFAPEP